VQPGFALRKLVYSLKPLDSEVRAASGHVATIRRRLESRLGVKRVVVIGSYARRAAIRHFSDLDVMAILPRAEARWGRDLVSPESFLTKIGDQLRERFVQTKVRTDGQAVVVHFGRSARAIDVVPAVFLGFASGRPAYRIPDSGGRWIETSPARHQRLFDESTERSGGKLRGVAQLIRAWKYGRDPPIPLSSFYADLLLCKTDVAAGVSSYGECLYAFFSHLARTRANGIRDPEGVAGIVPVTRSTAALDRVKTSAEYARAHSAAALHAEAAGDFDEAVRQWEIVFNRRLS
jgi:predicted nucleotidyltransferase